MSLGPLCAALHEEALELRALIEERSPDPEARTPFHGWTVADVVRHLVTVDGLARLALTYPPHFLLGREAFVAGTRAGDPAAPPQDVFRRIRDHEGRSLARLSWGELLDVWAEGVDGLCRAGRQTPPDARVAWFGPPMRVQTLLCARQMETWAYGRDVFDLLDVARAERDRLRNVADFAVRTYAFAFRNRGLAAPAPPFVGLTSPSGAEWTWGDPAAENRIAGPAVDFCLVATQRRHVLDTRLRVAGPEARRWVTIAQSIAGPALDPPNPGARLP